MRKLTPATVSVNDDSPLQIRAAVAYEQCGYKDAPLTINVIEETIISDGN